MPTGPDVPWTDPSQPSQTEDETVIEPVEPEVSEPELSAEQIAILEQLKDFFINYTTYIVQYIEKNAIYFSYNLVDFCIAVSPDLILSLQRKKYDIGDFEERKSYKAVDFNAICNDIDLLYFCDNVSK